VGFGGFERALHDLWEALHTGDIGAARSIAEKGDGSPLEPLRSWLSRRDLDGSIRRRLEGMVVEWPGRLEHGPLSRLLPSFDTLVVPSVVPEAFGMVAAEAAASGVLPIVPAHSGIGEVGAAVEEAIDRPGLLTYDPGSPIRGIAEAIDRVLAIDLVERRAMERAASELSHDRWSWERVATRLVELATS
jgi:glycosyltransferase involved in cell wall biosynthesis